MIGKVVPCVMNVERQYLVLLREALLSGLPHADRTGVGTRRLFARQLRHDMSTGLFPLLTTKRVPMRWVEEELRWMLLGRTDEGWLRERGVDIWKEWADEAHCSRHKRETGQLGPTYGAMLRRFPVGDAVLLDGNGRVLLEEGLGTYTDQLSKLVDDLLVTPGSRRLLMTLWHPWWQRKVDVPPCLVSVQLQAHDPPATPGPALSLHAHYRSSDLFLGLPFDLASAGLLLKLLCAASGRLPMELVMTLGDAHVYDNHASAVQVQLAREPRPLPALAVDYQSVTEWTTELGGYDPHPKIQAEVAV